MTAWYAGSSLVLILAATSFMYWVLAASFDVEDTRALDNLIIDLSLVLRTAPSLSVARVDEPGSVDIARRPEKIWLRVLDADGRVLVETPGMDEELPVTTLPSPPTDPTRRATDDVRARSGRRYRVMSARISGRTLQVAMDRANDRSLLTHYRQQLWLVLVGSLLVCSGVGFAIARSGMRPVRLIAATARNIRTSTLHERIGTAGLPAELQLLAGTFNEMLDRLEESFAQMSQFSADVAHELRTPVNNLRGEIEVVLGKARSADEYRETLGSALEECLRLTRLIQSLLFLSRAELGSGSPSPDLVPVRQEIDAVLEFYEPSAADVGVTLTSEVVTDIVAPFDRTLFQQAVGNLVANAIAHTPPGGRIAVRSGSDDMTLRIEVSDNGAGIAAQHVPFVFDRFYRADPARFGSARNAGLGLAVVKSIVALHGGRIAIDSKVGLGTTVTFETPLSVSRPSVG